MAWGHFAGKFLARPPRRPTTFSEAIMRRWLRSGTFKSGLCAILALWVAATCFSTASLLAPAPAMGQLEGEDAADKADAPPAAGNTSTQAATKPSERSLLEFTFESLGWLYSIAFLLLSFVFVALVVMNLLAARRENIVPVALVQGFEAFLNERKYQEAYELAKADESFLGQVLSAGLAKLSQGYPQAIEAMQEVGEEETMKQEHRLSYIALIGSISPMVGLLGTVHGMVESFMVIADAETSPPPADLAQGISKALVTTIFGLLLAIPAIAIYGILKNRFQRLSLEVGIVAESLMNRFQNVGKKT
jgi:biopolymer transport protein ExbB